MALKDVVKISRKTFFDPKSWLGYDSVKDSTNMLWGMLKGVFVPVKATRKETFEEAKIRLNLTEEQIQTLGKDYLHFALFFLVVGVSGMCLSIFFVLGHHFLGCLLALAISALFLSQAFKFHFWYFQIKYRKLGCTYEEWRQGRPNNRGVP